MFIKEDVIKGLVLLDKSEGKPTIEMAYFGQTLKGSPTLFTTLV